MSLKESEVDTIYHKEVCGFTYTLPMHMQVSSEMFQDCELGISNLEHGTVTSL